MTKICLQQSTSSHFKFEECNVKFIQIMTVINIVIKAKYAMMMVIITTTATIKKIKNIIKAKK